MNIHRARRVTDDWSLVKEELARAFVFARSAAQAEEHFVFVVHHDDLLGRGHAGSAMVATGLLSAVRTAALEGARKGWTANVLAYDDESDENLVEEWAERLATKPSGVSGELIRIGSSHLGKALP